MELQILHLIQYIFTFHKNLLSLNSFLQMSKCIHVDLPPRKADFKSRLPTTFKKNMIRPSTNDLTELKFCIEVGSEKLPDDSITEGFPNDT